MNKLIYNALDGYNMAIFDYGKNGSGKMYTIMWAMMP